MTRTKRRYTPQERELPYHAVRSNLGPIFLLNLKLAFSFLPAILCICLFYAVGGLIFLLAGVLLLIPAGPALAAALDTGYALARQVPRFELRPFRKSYRMNLRQGMAAMAILAPFAAILALLGAVQGDRPAAINLCLLLGSLLAVAFAVVTFSQIALVPLPLGSILKNSLLLLPAMGLRGLLAVLVDLLAIYALFRWMSYGLLVYLVGGAAVLAVWNCSLLWPRLKEVLIRDT